MAMILPILPAEEMDIAGPPTAHFFNALAELGLNATNSATDGIRLGTVSRTPPGQHKLRRALKQCSARLKLNPEHLAAA
jgi:hypothetical protein